VLFILFLIVIFLLIFLSARRERGSAKIKEPEAVQPDDTVGAGVSLPGTGRQPLTWRTLLGRLGAGILLGLIWDSLVNVAWLGVVLLTYGSLDDYLKAPKTGEGRWCRLPPFCHRVRQVSGGMVGPLAVGGAARVRRPVLYSSACGGALDAVLGWRWD
jgi:hypothetical protein